MPPAFLDAAVGGTFCVLGALLLRRPGPRVGALMAATGAVWLLGPSALGAPLAYRGPLIHLLVSYPRARPRGRWATGVVGAGYLLGLQPLAGSDWLTGILAVVVTATVVDGRRRATGADRRARMAPAWTCGVVMAILGTAAVARLSGRDIEAHAVWALEWALLVGAGALFADLRWGRWTTAIISSLVIDLGQSAGAGTVQEKLARALNDPDLRIGFIDAPNGPPVDELGRPVQVSPTVPGRARTTLSHAGDDIAVVVHAAGALDDPALRGSVTRLIWVAVANARLQTALEQTVGEVSASRQRILQVADRERAVLEAEIQDGPEERLGSVERLLDPSDAALHRLLQDGRSSLRDFARGVHPRALAQGGLVAGCAELARRAPIPVQVDVPDLRFTPEVELSLYFVCSEALTNTVKHANASKASIRLAPTATSILLTIVDDGQGGAVIGSSAPDGRTGLSGLVERLAVLGGALTLDSPAGQGTTITAAIPWSTARTRQ
jgi:signal transduction histidine kinase